MSDLPTRPIPVPSGSSIDSLGGRPQSLQSSNRDATNARLATPITSVEPGSAIGNVRGPDSTSRRHSAARQTPLGGSPVNSSRGPRESALATALHPSVVQSPPRTLTHLHGTGVSGQTGALAATVVSAVNYDIIDPGFQRTRGGWNSPKSYEDFDIVRKHLAGPANPSPFDTDGTNGIASVRGKAAQSSAVADPYDGSGGPKILIEEDVFSSLRMQGGDITREIYRRTDAETVKPRGKLQRSRSLNISHDDSAGEELDKKNIREPGGFRRNHISRMAQGSVRSPSRSNGVLLPATGPRANFVTRNFFEYLSLYGHFAGEDIDEEDGEEDFQGTASKVDTAPDNSIDDDAGDEIGEESPLLGRVDSKRRCKDRGPRTGTSGTIMLLLKSFVGTGVLFLPRAFLNGGMLFSCLVLLSISLVSYYCFVLLTKSRLILKGSFAEMGEITHGKYMRALINLSLVLSQMGFASAYIVFTSENLQAFVLAVSDCKTYINIKVMILMQLVLFLPLSLYRNLNNISHVVYMADVFIVAGLVYLYYYGIRTLAAQHGIADIVLFNQSGWPLFIGTAIFTFEGIGLILPIQDGMRKPQQLPVILGGVMVIITLIFISMGALSYAAYGSDTETVIILNMPQDSKVVNAVQFIYSLAILLSTPMQIFPAITIMEHGVFDKSGKYSKNIKWQKNGFRFIVVMVSALIAWVGANDLDKFVALVGSFACIPLVYIYPPLIHRKAVATARWSKGVDLLLCIFGFTLMAYTTGLTIMSWVSGHQEKIPGYCDR